MKTETHTRIVDIIRKKSGSRPIELIKELGLSPQAIHRHL
ncbi:MAG: winged helix-turn-helix domain-containing protein, partial [Elusimicrobia bacterium]|nr:winged helix-turn-helix domain-containing protein [Elusimicrobiota bacterium]